MDGDKISITLTGKYVLEDYTITAEVKVIEIPLATKQVDTLKVITLNDGNLPPHTAATPIDTNFEHYPILTMAKMKEARTINLNKKLK